MKSHHLSRHTSGMLFVVIVTLLSSHVAFGRHLLQRGETSVAQSGFLEDEIPLNVVSTTPEELAVGRRITVTGREPLTVILSRPVIGLGQTIKREVPDELKPFFLVPEVAGEYRWLTTHIATFEPAEDWAPDLEVEFEWNVDLVSFDGVPFEVRANSGSQITTPTLELRAVAVTSKSADNVTDGFWDAFVGTSFDILPEIPDDGFVQLASSSPVNLGVLQNSLFLVDTLTNGNPPVQVIVKECTIPKLPCVDCPDEDDSSSAPTVNGGGAPVFDPNIYGGEYQETETESEPDPATPVEENPSLTGSTSRCINVSFTSEERGGFLQGRKYSLVLPAETQYSNEAGRLTDDIRINFAGLRDFRVPFVEDKSFNISNPRLQIWLPHGLADGVNVTDFPMKIVRAKDGQDVKFSLEMVSRSVVRIVASFTPGSTYRISVFESPNFKDGYGLNLKRSNLNFLAAPIDHFFGTMQVGEEIPLAIFEEDEKWGEKIVVLSKGSAISDKSVCKKAGSVINVWDITKPNAALPLLTSEPLDEPVADFLGLATKRFVDERKDIAGESNEIDIAKLLQSTGVAAAAYCRDDVYHPLVVCSTQIQVAVLVTSAANSKGRVTLVWVTDMKSASLVVGASVVLYRNDKNKGYVPVGEGETEKQGVATLTVDHDDTELHAVVTYKGKAIYVPNVKLHNGAVSSISDSIVLDRPVARPGELLHIKGYIMENEGGSYLPANVKNVRLVVTPSMVSSTKESDVLPVQKYNKEFGSYTLSLEIPLSVTSIEHTITVQADVAGGETYVGGSEPFTVVDSRQAPAILTVDAPDWALPNKKLTVNAKVTSFAGAPIQDAKLSFTWHVFDDARHEDDELLVGRVTSSTDKKGETKATIDLSVFQNPPSAGTILMITAHYTGSSGERVAQSTEVRYMQIRTNVTCNNGLLIRLEPANAEIFIEKTVDTNIIGQSFGARAVVFDLKGKQLTSGSPITFALKQITAVRKDGRPTLKPTTSNRESPGKAVSKCTKSLKSTEYCTFELPKMGEYVLEACTKVGKGKVCKRCYLGHTEEDWNESPLQDHIPLGIQPESVGPYTVGQSASFTIENPFESATALLSWGTRDAVSTKTVAVKSGRSSLKFELDNTCLNNCALSISIAIPRQKKGLAAKPGVPVNSVFDPAMPHIVHYSTVIDTKRRSASLGMQISLPGIKIDGGMPLIEPGFNASVRVTFDSKKPVEITAFAIDTAILDLLPYPLKDVSNDFISDLSDYFRYKSTSNHMVAPGAIDAITKKNEARKKLDPWFKMISTLQPSDATANIDLTDDQYLAQYVQFLTVVPRTAEEMAEDLVEQSTFSNGVKKEKTNGTVTESSAPLGLQPSYVTPTLFESFTASGGIWLVNFEGPREGGVFAIRAYASTGGGLFGSDEVIVKVQKQVSIKSEFPVFARLGDQFDASLTISILNKAVKPLSVSIDVSDNLKMDGPDNINLVFGNARERTTRFKFRAVGIGEAKIAIVADNGSGRDAKETIRLTIFGPQPPVVHSASFPVAGDSNEESISEIKVPEALEGSGALVVAAGHGFLPGALLLADQIYTEDSFTCPVSADFVLASIAIPAIVDTYFPWSPDPNLLPKFYVDLINKMIPKYQQAVSLVYAESTSVILGLKTEIPCLAMGVSKPTGVSIEQNARGIFIVNEVEKKLREHNLEDIYKHTAAVFTARDTWAAILEASLIDEAAAAREKKKTISTTTVAIARMALGAQWSPVKGTDSGIVSDLSMNRLKKSFDSMSVEGQAYYILAVLGAKQKDQGTIKKAVASWTSKITSVGEKAYVTTGKGSVTAETSLVNSLVFLAMVRAKASSALLAKMAHYVVAPVSDMYGFTQYPTFGKTVAILGLVQFDQTQKIKKVNVRLEIRTGTNVLFSAAFTPGRSTVSAQSTKWKELGKSPQPIQAFPQGDGQVNVGVAMKYVPRDPLDSPVYKGIFVDRVIQLDSAGPISQMVTKVPLGTVLSITIEFKTPKNLGRTTVQVYMPAGLEPVQLGAQNGEYCPIPFFDLFDEDVYESCPEQIIHADQVQFDYESVGAGSHAISFKAVAAISGSYGMPPTRVFAAEDPSIMGMSGATRLSICEAGKACGTENSERDHTFTACANDCSQNGVCDLSEGSCVCFYGFAGEDCKKAGAV